MPPLLNFVLFALIMLAVIWFAGQPQRPEGSQDRS
jgi:hypothetical protein